MFIYSFEDIVSGAREEEGKNKTLDIEHQQQNVSSVGVDMTCGCWD